MKARCIDNNFGYEPLTIAKVYDILEEGDFYYLVLDDDGDKYKYPKELFNRVS